MVSWAALGSLLATLGVLLGALGALLGLLGVLSGALGALLGFLGVLLGALGALLGLLGALLDDLGPSWGDLGGLLRRPWPPKKTLKTNTEKTSETITCKGSGDFLDSLVRRPVPFWSARSVF